MDAWPALGLSAMPRDDESPATPAERSRWAAVEASFHDRPVTDLAQAWVEEELRVIEAAESVKAWADAQGLAALRRLHEAVGMVVQEQADSISMYDDGVLSYAAVVAETTTAAVDEVALATGLPEGQVAARLTLALDEEGRSTPLLEALARGEVGLDRSLRIRQVTAALAPRSAGRSRCDCWLRWPTARCARTGRSSASCAARSRCTRRTRPRRGRMPYASGAPTDGWSRTGPAG